MMSGLFILWLTIGGFMGHFDSLWERVQETSCELIQVQCLGAKMADTGLKSTDYLPACCAWGLARHGDLMCLRGQHG